MSTTAISAIAASMATSRRLRSEGRGSLMRDLRLEADGHEVVAVPLEGDARERSRRGPRDDRSVRDGEDAVVTRTLELPPRGVVDDGARQMRAHLAIGDVG